MIRSIAVLVAAAVLVLPACGEGGDQTLPGRASQTAEATPAPEEGGGDEGFLAAANEVCEKADERMSAVEAPATQREWLGFGRRIERRFVRMLDDLAALDPPDGLRGDFRKWLGKLERSRHAFRSLYRTIALHYPEVEGPKDRVSRAMQRAFARDTKARQWAQLRLTDLYSCYNSAPWYYARAAAPPA